MRCQRIELAPPVRTASAEAGLCAGKRITPTSATHSKHSNAIERPVPGAASGPENGKDGRKWPKGDWQLSVADMLERTFTVDAG